MKKNSLLLLLFTLFVVGCNDTQISDESSVFNSEIDESIEETLSSSNSDVENNYPVSFSFTEKHGKNVDVLSKQIYDDFTYLDKKQESIFYNLMPNDIIDNYDLNAILMQTNTTSDIYLYYKNVCIKVFNLPEWNCFMLTDINSDSFFELISIQANNNIVGFNCYDSKYNISSANYSLEGNYAFTKVISENEIGIYLSEENDINKANELIYTFEKNNKQFNITQSTYELSTDNFDLQINFLDNNPLSNPSISNYDISTFIVGNDEKTYVNHFKNLIFIETILTWKGDSFSYTQNHMEPDYAFPFLQNENFVSTHRKNNYFWGIKDFVVNNGDVIKQTFTFDQIELPDGTYDLMVEYRNEKVVVNKALSLY